MKKFLIILFTVAYLPLFVLYLVSRVDETKVCDVLPKGINYKVVLDDMLFDLTEHGLVARGQYIDFNKFEADIAGPILDNKNKIIYFYTTHAFSYSGLLEGIYKLDLADQDKGPEFISQAENGIKPVVSPDGKYLVFYQNVQTLEEKQKHGWLYNLVLLNLETKELRQLEDNAHYDLKPSWINDRQFIYYSDKDNTLFLFDVDKDGRQDLQIRGSFPGSLTLDKKHLLLSGGNNTSFFNVETKRVDKVIDQVVSNKAIWMPNGRGCIFHNHILADTFSIPINELGGVSYYSLDTNKQVRLMGGLLRGGFVIPPDIKIKVMNNDLSIKAFMYYEVSPGPLKKVCTQGTH